MQPIKKVIFKPKIPMQIEAFRIEDVLAKYLEDVIHPHRTNFYHLIILESGNPTHFVDFEPVTLQENCLFTINKECVHYFDRNEPYNGYVIIFTDEFFCNNENNQRFLQNTPLFNNPQLNAVITNQAETLPFFTSTAQTIKDFLIKESFQNQHDFLHNLLHNLLIFAENLYNGQKEQPNINSIDYEIATLFRDLVEKNYSKQKSVSFFASQLSITEKRLGMAAQRIYGKLPKEMIDDRVMLEAKRLLSHSALSVKEIGIQLGFDDPAYFFRFFKKNAHSTPLEFREKYQSPA